MSLELLEAAVDALASYFKDNMTSKLATLDAEYSDFTLDQMKNWYIGQFPKALPEYPCCVILGEAWSPEEQRGVNLHVANVITIVIFVGDDNEELRFRKLCRYARATVELLQEGEGTYGYEHLLEDAIKLSDIIAAEPFIQAVGIPITLHKLEAY